MLAEERQATLLQHLQANGYVEVDDMAARLGVAAITIRRDLERLAAQGRCIRTRGGAMRAAQSTTFELPYDIKRHRHQEEKRRIAMAAAEMVRDGETIILDAGSTTRELAGLLLRKRGLTVVTNDLQIAVCLASSPGIALVCTGGVARANVYTLLGPQVEAFLRTLRVDKAFLGADAVHPDGTVANVSLEEVAVKQAMIQAGEQVILLADASKFALTAFARVCSLDAVSALISDRGVTEATLAMLQGWPITVQVV